MVSPIKKMIFQGENETLDFKKTISNSNKIAKTLVAFANNQGGKLLIGVADDGKIIGVKDEDEEKFMLTKAAVDLCKPALELYFEECIVDDKLVLIAHIPKGQLCPYYGLDENGKWWAYIRIGDQTTSASPVMLEVLKIKERPVNITYTSLEQKLFEHLATHTSISLKEFSKLTRLSNKKCIKILSALIAAKILSPLQAGASERYAQNTI